MRLSPAPFFSRGAITARGVCAAAALSLVAIHLATLSAPSISSPIWDDVALSDYAVHGRRLLWEEITPPSQRFRLVGFTGALWKGYSLTQGWIFRRIGVGGIQSKLGVSICGLIGLLVLAWFPWTVGLPWYYSLILLLFGFTTPFFDITHSARPEGYVFLAAAINWLWYFRGGGRVFSFLTGLAATGALSFHPAMVLSLAPLLTMVAIFRRRELLTSPRYSWWVIGALLGLIASMSVVDGEQIGYLTSLGNGLVVKPPPLLSVTHEPLRVARGALDFILGASRQGYAWRFLLCCTVGSIFIQLRHFDRLGTARREVLCAGLLTALSFSLLQSSAHPRYYFAYLEPWLLMALMPGVDMLLNREVETKLADQIFLVAAHLALLASMLQGFWTLSLASFAAALIARAEVPARLRSLALVATGLTLVAAIALFDGFLWDFAVHTTYLLRYRPLVLLLLLGLPWLLMIPDERSADGRRGSAVRFRRVFLAYCLINFALCVAQFPSAAAAPSVCPYPLKGEFATRLARLKSMKRLVAPDELFFYAPQLSFQSTMAVHPRPLYANMARTLIDYSPSLVLWPVAEEDMLRNQLAALGDRRHRFDWGPVWRAPTGDWRELRIVASSRAPL